jgi:hypothetical protein
VSTDVRCYQCGQFFPAEETTRVDVQTGQSSGWLTGTDGIMRGNWSGRQVQRVDICPDCFEEERRRVAARTPRSYQPPTPEESERRRKRNIALTNQFIIVLVILLAVPVVVALFCFLSVVFRALFG